MSTKSKHQQFIARKLKKNEKITLGDKRSNESFSKIEPIVNKLLKTKKVNLEKEPLIVNSILD